MGKKKNPIIAIDSVNNESKKVLFLCDRRACNTCTQRDEGTTCKYTSDIRHAKNFELNGSIFVETPPVEKNAD